VAAEVKGLRVTVGNSSPRLEVEGTGVKEVGTIAEDGPACHSYLGRNV